MFDSPPPVAPKQIRTTTIAKIMDGHVRAVIECPIKGEIVRRLDVIEHDGETLLAIDACDGQTFLNVPMDQEIWLEEWVFDRGSLLMDFEGHTLKFATQFDTIRYPDTDKSASLDV